MVSLWEISWRRFVGKSSRLCVTRIVLRRACSCEVRWGGAARCGTRAQLFGAVAGVFAGFVGRRTECPSLREIHVVTLFLRAVFPCVDVTHPDRIVDPTSPSESAAHP